jgi:hypothetical protein
LKSLLRPMVTSYSIVAPEMQITGTDIQLRTPDGSVKRPSVAIRLVTVPA